VITFYAIWASTNFQKKVVRAFWLWGVLTILFSFVLRPPIPPPANHYPILPIIQTAFAVRFFSLNNQDTDTDNNSKMSCGF
jgi:hypothetical protein